MPSNLLIVHSFKDVMEDYFAKNERLFLAMILEAIDYYIANQTRRSYLEIVIPFDPIEVLNIDVNLFEALKGGIADEVFSRKCNDLLVDRFANSFAHKPKLKICPCPLYVCPALFEEHYTIRYTQTREPPSDRNNDFFCPSTKKLGHWFQIDSAIVAELEWQSRVGDSDNYFGHSDLKQRYLLLSRTPVRKPYLGICRSDRKKINLFKQRDDQRGVIKIQMSPNPLMIPSCSEISVGSMVRIVGFYSNDIKERKNSCSVSNCHLVGCLIEIVQEGYQHRLSEACRKQSLSIYQQPLATTNLVCEARHLLKFVFDLLNSVENEKHSFKGVIPLLTSNQVSIAALLSINLAVSAEILMKYFPEDNEDSPARGRIHLQLMQNPHDASLIYSLLCLICSARCLPLRRLCHQTQNIIPCTGYPGRIESSMNQYQNTRIVHGFMAAGPCLHFVPNIQILPKSKLYSIKSSLWPSNSNENLFNKISIVHRATGACHEVSCSGTLCFTLPDADEFQHRENEKVQVQQLPFSPTLSTCFTSRLTSDNMYHSSCTIDAGSKSGDVRYVTTGRPKTFTDEAHMLLEHYADHASQFLEGTVHHDSLASCNTNRYTKNSILTSASELSHRSKRFFEEGSLELPSKSKSQISHSSTDASRVRRLLRIALASAAARGKDEVGVVDALITITLIQISDSGRRFSEKDSLSYCIFGAREGGLDFLQRLLGTKPVKGRDPTEILLQACGKPICERLASLFSYIIRTI
ncbi:phosphatidylserine decarboxylase [Perkinsela sp. CCAP 1560/4]|nr:phosphatidylserine decarboxylase [Perkinsela sp. CCAP 1560/4]|eukprot:KNH07609.1 phosphatidylserine decarboxylase [Perkinsela sp. CCAP 1560/4]